MKSLKPPLEKHLAPPLDEARLHRLAMAVQARRNRPQTRARRLVLSAVAVGLALVLWRAWPTPPAATLSLATGEPMPLALAGAARVPFTFSDGSRIELDEEAKAEVMVNQPTRVGLVLRQGRARFSVTPGGPRQWVIEAGEGTVEVVGTVFTVDRHRGLSVSVERGVVLVRSPRLPDGVQRLTAGERVDLPPLVSTPPPEPVPEAPSSPPASPEARPAPTQPEPVPATRTPPPPAPPASNVAQDWRALTGQAAWAALGDEERTKVVTGTNLVELLQLADLARLTGHVEVARASLRQYVVVAPRGDPEANAARYSLARLELEAGEALRAADDFGEVAQRGGPLAEEALFKQVTALLAANQPEAAASVAATIVRSTPSSPRTRRVERWLEMRDAGAAWPF